MTTAPFVRLHPEDNIAVAARKVPEATPFSFAGTSDLSTVEPIEMGHKVALRSIDAGQPIKKFGQTIGYASQAIPQGGWVHVHNVSAGEAAERCSIRYVQGEPPTAAERGPGSLPDDSRSSGPTTRMRS